MADIDEEKLQMLMELVLKENPELDPYFIWVITTNYLLNEKNIYGDEEYARELKEKRDGELKYSIRVE
jgi:hypothetical protein